MAISVRARLLIALCVVLAILGVLIKTAITHASTYYVTVSQLYNEGSQAVGQQTTVSGNIVGASVNYNPQAELLRFSVRDGSNGRPLPVVFHGAEPDDFSNNWPVVVTGTLKSNGVFQASQLLIKCPSKYQAGNSTQPQTQTFNAID
ncbi:cytochrome c maturation protein CcmE [Alicyclobacillus cycloheptanicus]|uniref:Cytochrome c-type biogenesis protein CcmE n=1 Tax=Alicyclobacillus cycloheptanicus TaxID=1457 RepID=A0ABT9XDL3_9BACL|nr:cytochrome c maturation protein CcmE [Alicyclobacillus cycloheptanicus]MDQ0188393.1 cytochrome c-type biogenesis protein CcmE [Alicyclobacillus cycloheptanicus]WDM01099.1 cytochrome c maturation protein CcmE [Alicyclobacillus cycloheptanicus]